MVKMIDERDRVEVTWVDEDDIAQGIKVGMKGTIMAVPSIGPVLVDIDDYPIERYMVRGQLKVIEV